MLAQLRSLAPRVGAVALLTAIAAADVLVVQTFPIVPGTYQTIQAAVDAASDGDVILVRSEHYDGFVINGKALDVVGEVQFGFHTQVNGSIRVANVPAGKRVSLSGFEVTGFGSPALYAGYGLLAFDDAGHVRVQDCILTGASNAQAPSNCQGWGDDSGWEAARISNCADVAFTRCVLTGGNGLAQDTTGASGCWEETAGGDGGHGLDATGSQVAVYDCALVGGDGGYGATGSGTSQGAFGGHGARIASGALFASGSAMHGGDGGFFFDILALPVPGGPGGDGLRMAPGVTSTLLDCDLAGGAGGLGGFFGISGPDGQPSSGGAVVGLAGTARSFAAAVPEHEAQPLAIQLAGEPSDAVFVLAALGDAYLPLPQFHGVLLAANPIVLNIATLGAGGTASVSVPLPTLAPGVQGVTVPLQSVFVQTDFSVYLGPPLHLVILDAAI